MVDEPVMVTCPAPSCMTMHENPVNPAAVSAVNVTADAELIVTIFPLSPATSVYPDVCGLIERGPMLQLKCFN